MNHAIPDLLDSMRGILHGIRASAPVILFSRHCAASSDIRTGYVDGRPVRRLVITLRGPGCGWVTRGDGCIMCGHHAGTTRGVVPTPEEYLAQFRSELARYDLCETEVLSLYNSGSMLNPEEIPRAALEQILADIRDLPTIRKVVLETRAEYVSGERLSRLRDILGAGKSLSIAMGLETSDDKKRSLCLNKGCSLAEIRRAVEAARGLARVQLYTILGIPFLTEAEAVEDTVHTIRCARDMGADEIHIEPLTIQKHTAIEYLYRNGLYRLPSLYSIYAVLRAVVPEIRPYVSPFLHMPLPEVIPNGCPSCTGLLIDGLLKRYNIHRDRESLDYPPCACQKIWRELMTESDDRPLEERVGQALELLAARETK